MEEQTHMPILRSAKNSEPSIRPTSTSRPWSFHQTTVKSKRSPSAHKKEVSPTERALSRERSQQHYSSRAKAKAKAVPCTQQKQEKRQEENNWKKKIEENPVCQKRERFVRVRMRKRKK